MMYLLGPIRALPDADYCRCADPPVPHPPGGTWERNICSVSLGDERRWVWLASLILCSKYGYDFFIFLVPASSSVCLVVFRLDPPSLTLARGAASTLPGSCHTRARRAGGAGDGGTGVPFPRGGPRGHPHDGRLQPRRDLHAVVRRASEWVPLLPSSGNSVGSVLLVHRSLRRVLSELFAQSHCGFAPNGQPMRLVLSCYFLSSLDEKTSLVVCEALPRKCRHPRSAASFASDGPCRAGP